MNKKKHLFSVVGLLILTGIFGILSYCVLFDILIVDAWIGTVISLAWVFIICLAVGFALAFPREKISRKDRKKERGKSKVVQEEKTIPYEAVEEESGGKDEEGLPLFTDVTKGEGIPELTITKTAEPKCILDEEISVTDSDKILDKDKGRKPDGKYDEKLIDEFLQKTSEVIEMMSELGLNVAYDIERKEFHLVNIEEEKEEFIDSIKSHIDEINDGIALKEKTEHATLDRKVDNITKTENKSDNDAQESLRQRVRKYLKSHPDATKEEIAEKFNTSNDVARQYIKGYHQSCKYREREKNIKNT